MKQLFLAALMLFSFSVFADCASNVDELKNLVGNSGLDLNWKENAKSNQLILHLSNGNGNLHLKLTKNGQLWGDVTGVVCKKSATSYYAQVANIAWGPSAPMMVKLAKIKQLNLELPYQSLLKVSVAGFGFNFSPL
jgi:hypothetical protein